MRAWLPPMSNYDLALVRGAFRDLAELEAARGRTGEADRWTRLASRLPDDVIDPATGSLMFAAGLPYDASHRHFSHALAIHPLGQIPGDGPVARATLDVIRAKGTDQWVGYSFSWFAAMLARTGRGDEALDMLQACNTGHDGSLTTVHANTPRDALSLALFLAITARTVAQSKRAVEMADSIAANMNAADIKAAKRSAKKWVEAQ